MKRKRDVLQKKSNNLYLVFLLQAMKLRKMKKKESTEKARKEKKLRGKRVDGRE